MQYSGFWGRVAAQLIDGVIINIFVSLGTFLVDQIFIFNMYIGYLCDSIDPIFLMFKAWYGLGYWCIFLLYEVLFTGSVLEATPGKLLLGARVVDKEGNRVSYWRSLMRFLGKFFSGLLAIGFLMVGFTERKQGLHDKIAGTLVIQSQDNIIVKFCKNNRV